VVGKVRFHQVVVEAAPGYLTQFGQTMPLRQRQVLQTILRCRTPALGGQLFACPACRTHHFRYHSCNHRFCPQCGQTDAQEWLARQQQRLLLPVPYFLVTFTVPEGLRAWMRSHPKLAYDLLFAASSQATQELGRNPKRLGALLGMLGVLHTWSRTLIFHPHIHYLVPAGGLSPDLLRWVGTRKPDYFLNEFALADRCRNLLGQMLQHQAPQEFKSIPAKVWKQRWRVQCKAAGSGQAALVYLSRYVFKTATANRWVERLADGRVRWPYRDSNTGQWMHLDLEPSELLRRYLQHVLPKGFTRVRAFGWFHPAGRQNLNRVRALLGTAPVLSAQECAAWLEQADLDDDQQPEPSPEAPKTDTPATTSTAAPAPLCPRCRQPMQLLAQWRRGGLLPLLAIARAPP
jgi:hypothetical protein